jgi:hypothetical protein
MKGIGLGAGEGSEDMSNRAAKQIKNKKLAASTEKNIDRRIEARVGELGGALKGIGLGGEKTKENDPKAISKSGESEFDTGFSNNLRGDFN